MLLLVGCQSSPVERATPIATRKAGTASSGQMGALARLEGIWVAETVTSSGKVVPDEKFPFEIHFEPPDQMIFKFVGNAEGRHRVHTIRLDGSKDPATMDITRVVRGKPETVFAIYQIETDRLMICSLRSPDGQPSSERPTNFLSDGVTKADLLVLKRKAKTNE